MLRSLFSGVSGLKNHQTRMDVIGNNISNVNTTGFKSSRVTFSDTLSQTLTGAAAASEGKGGTNPKQIGLGSQVSSVDMLFTDGSVQSTGKNTDLCLSGSGLFVVKNSNGTFYTRNGAFSFDEQGNYVTSDGSYVQGWTALDGTLDTNGTPGNITIPAGKSMASKESKLATYVNNLNSAAPTIKSISYTDPSGATQILGQLSATTLGVDFSNKGTNPLFSLKDPSGGGNPIKLTYGASVTSVALSPAAPATPTDTILTFSDGSTAMIAGNTNTGIKVGDTITTLDDNAGKKFDTSNPPSLTVDGTNVTTATLIMSDGSKQVLPSGTYTIGNSIPISTTFTIYDSLGNAHAVPVLIEKIKGNTWQLTLSGADSTTNSVDIKEADGSVSTYTMPPAIVEFTADGAYKTGSAVLKTSYDATNGASPGSITLDLSNLTQYSGSSTINASADGNAAGTLSSVSVDSSGIITGTYTNGVIQYEAQVAVAQFNNSAGLTKVGGSYYQESNNSGVPNVKTAAKLGVTITPSALEMSNVDIADQFSDMIITQRGFQSNSKIITVSDEILETLINMKR